MTPKEKAEDLVNKMYNQIQPDELGKDYNSAKQCALIAVDELIIEKNKWENGSFYTSKYWDYVKQEIEKL
jgi:hypothetical protein